MNKLPAPFDSDQRAALQAAIDEIIPPEHDHQGGWRDGVESYLDTEWHGVLDWAHELVTSAVGALTAHPSLSTLEQAQQDALIRIAHEGFYAAPHLKEPPGWRVVGFSPIPEGVQAIEPDPLPTIALSAADETYDTIVACCLRGLSTMRRPFLSGRRQSRQPQHGVASRLWAGLVARHRCGQPRAADRN